MHKFTKNLMKRSWDISQKSRFFGPILTFRSRFHGNKNFLKKSGRVTFLFLWSYYFMQINQKNLMSRFLGKVLTDGHTDATDARTDKH